MGGGVPIHTNPLAQQLQSKGRGEDTMLVHMTPNEVNSLQGLAMAHGGSLTINPETGLPEAGWLGKLLPTILGAALAATGVGAPLAAGLVAAGSVAKTGSLKKGLMAGLQAFGGAGLAGVAGLGGAISSNAGGILGNSPGLFGANMGLGAAAAPGVASAAAPAVTTAAPPAAMTGGVQTVTAGAAIPTAPGGLTASLGGVTAPTSGLVPSAMQGGGAQFTGGLGSRFGQAVRAGLPEGTPGIVSKMAPMMAAQGAVSGIGGALSSVGRGGTAGPDGQIDNSYQGPYYAQDRQQIKDPEGPLSSKQRRHFAIDMPETYNTMGQVVQPGSHTVRGTQIMQPVLNPKAKKGQPMYNFVPVTYQGGIDPNEEDSGYARGGEVQLADGAFVLDARTVSEIGNGSSNAGMEALRRMGGQPVQGPGDGVSDSVPARIGKDQPARVARDEVIMPANVVRRIGKGNPQRGADKLYALMDKAHKARKKAGRGHDTKLARGLG